MLIRGGTVVDGAGAPARVADVAIINDHIVDIAATGAFAGAMLKNAASS